jgi:hypothetical protein
MSTTSSTAVAVGRVCIITAWSCKTQLITAGIARRLYGAHVGGEL